MRVSELRPYLQVHMMMPEQDVECCIDGVGWRDHRLDSILYVSLNYSATVLNPTPQVVTVDSCSDTAEAYAMWDSCLDWQYQRLDCQGQIPLVMDMRGPGIV